MRTTAATNYIVLTFQFNFVATFKVDAAAWAADEKLLNIFSSLYFVLLFYFGSMFAYNSCCCCYCYSRASAIMPLALGVADLGHMIPMPVH